MATRGKSLSIPRFPKETQASQANHKNYATTPSFRMHLSYETGSVNQSEGDTTGPKSGIWGKMS
jgi:hypothetical protein